MDGRFLQVDFVLTLNLVWNVAEKHLNSCLKIDIVTSAQFKARSQNTLATEKSPLPSSSSAPSKYKSGRIFKTCEISVLTIDLLPL